MEQSEINSHLISHALAGKTVVRLKGGDALRDGVQQVEQQLVRFLGLSQLR